MSSDAQRILGCLAEVARQRELRAANPGLARAAASVKQFQLARFAATYQDMLVHPRFGKAALFFLHDLYGDGDFSERDEQFARVVPALVRTFSVEIVKTVAQLTELHALSEQLDSAMAAALTGQIVDAVTYERAWRSVGRPGDRKQQIELMLEVGRALDGLTRRPVLRHSLRLMRVPARAAGLGALQAFLERGFDTFRDMRGAEEFLQTIATRETTHASTLFGLAGVAQGTGGAN